MNSEQPFVASGRLSTLGVLRFQGRDALSFLQGQLSNDTARLATADQALLAAYSTPQGRVLAVMTLLSHSSGTLAILPVALLEPIAARLRKFVLRAKVRIDIAGEAFAVVAAHGTAALAAAGLSPPTAPNGYREDDGLGMARRGPSERFYLVGSVADLAAKRLLGDENDSQIIANSWRLAEIRDGLPQVYQENTEEFVAQMLNLDLIDAISFRKGCYTGQEIIARTQHLGRIKRRMYRLGLPAGTWTPGQSIRLTDGRSGRLVDVAESADTAVETLTVLTPSDGSADPLSGVPATELPLPYSLSVAA